MKEYPHQLSGGLRQRAMIAMALAPRPKLLIADEPTTALDVTIQAQILDLLVRLKEEFHLSLLMISHDLGVIAQIADEVAVMYAGKIVEFAPAREIFSNPLHPYTEGLLKSIPRWAASGKAARRLESIPGVVPDPRRLPPGCAFQPRCKDDRGDPCGRAPISLTTLPNKSPGALCEVCLSVWISFSRSFLIGCFVTGPMALSRVCWPTQSWKRSAGQ